MKTSILGILSALQVIAFFGAVRADVQIEWPTLDIGGIRSIVDFSKIPTIIKSRMAIYCKGGVSEEFPDLESVIFYKLQSGLELAFATCRRRVAFTYVFKREDNDTALLYFADLDSAGGFYATYELGSVNFDPENGTLASFFDIAICGEDTEVVENTYALRNSRFSLIRIRGFSCHDQDRPPRIIWEAKQ